MHRGFARPTASSASRSINPEDHEQIPQETIRTRQPQHDISRQSESTSSERRSSNQSNSTLEPHRKKYHPFLSEPSSSAGKSPCGPILMAEHAYRESIQMKGPSSKVDARIDGRPGTACPSTKSGPTENQSRKDIVLEPESSPPLPRREAPQLLSVHAAKDFFENKAFQNQTVNPLSQPAARGTKTGRVKDQIQKLQPSTPSRPSRGSYTSERTYNPTGARIAEEVDPSFPLPQPMYHLNQGQLAPRTSPSRPVVKGGKHGSAPPRNSRLDVDRPRRTSRTTDDIHDPLVAKESTRSGQRRNSE
jgi:hypothetical protein